MTKRKFYIAVGLLIAAGVLSACGAVNTYEQAMPPGQPAISVAQRQVSILTPTREQAFLEEITAPVEGETPAMLPSDTLEPSQIPSEQGSTTPLPSETAEVVGEATAANVDVSNTLIPTNTQAANVPLQASSTPLPSFTSTPTTPVPVETATAIPTEESEAPPPEVCDPGGSSAFEAEVISLINAERAKESLAGLTIQSQLTTAARNHSDDMSCNDFFSHNSPTSGSPFDRISAAGYSYSWAGENIAAGHGTPSALVEGWMDSQGHRDNILNANFTQIGIGYAYWESSDFGVYWTAVFAAP
jgi:uncharacterized protein YkwD